ncbi:LOW QUALITY PROTEIN: probable RNA-binding protein 19 [Maniola hyperantus]|uniref:LOW QUALITY PROTEIN: probable RNA-binding protein 19 n=1 Tax=Aphantopus hyperantus TaxID=2795564 RepID=UPI00156A4945|nr:LOW QUALITY PROTEIN: probable RNA-binding protein 19 [Maniola hyperantus]
MSRLIVKNLPNKVTVEKLKDLFSEKGEVTDVQLKYTKDGKFRNFGFVGYRKEEQAAVAREHFDGTFINSMKINVELCANLGDEKKPKAWSKYASDSTAYKKLHKNEAQENVKPKKDKLSKAERNKNKIKELLTKHKDDPLFAEFIEAHVNEKTVWIKEALEETGKSDDSGVEDEKPNEDSQQVNPPEDKPPEDGQEKQSKEKVANTGISDLEYMKLLMKKVDGFKEKDKKATVEEVKPKKVRNRPLFYVKITGLPYKCKKKDVKAFFKPLVPFSIRLPLEKKKKLTGFCYVGFRTEKELNKALTKDKLFIGNHRLHVHKYEDRAKKEAEEQEQQNSWKNRERENNEESVGESGSIFVRNLAYVVSEEELTQLFEKYGPLAEVHMPIDPILRQPKGFATVTFVIPEHAVKAYTELDGTAFCGRMLHLLPAKTEKLEDEDNDEGLSFKEKKAKKLKQQAKSSHNWNALFLGVNAVADVVAANYNTTKEQLLSDNNKNTSAAVRLALGETQLVAETKSFLESNGVYLDAFNRPAKKRSKTCILVKNLPAGTDKDEIKVLFEKHGQLARFLMPNHGITALVDFIEPFEAKKAFGKLAYSQFKSGPLYLEWAPENVFVKSAEKPQEVSRENSGYDAKENEIEKPMETKMIIDNKQEEKKQEKAEEPDEYIEEEPPENDTTLFVKNINFKTTEASLRAHFSGCGRIHSVTIAKKKDPKNPGQFLSMGYGFVQFVKKQHANEALKELQSSTLDGKTLELKRSERGNTMEVKSSKKSTKDTVQNGTKILVRNVPFQANRKELHEIFRAFGDIKTLRLPKKLTAGTDQHRGFAFVDFYSKADAKSAFEALCQSTHLYGRRLVLEWADQSDENEDIGMLRKRTAQSFNAKVPGGKKSRKGAVDVETFLDPDNNIV